MGNTTERRLWEIHIGDSPILATAIHDGHIVRNDVAPYMEISGDVRHREEDPYTGELASVAPNRVIVTHSRFEIDLNRPRERAVYHTPEDAWGLQVWKSPPPDRAIARSLAEYDTFYAEMELLLDDLYRRTGPFVVLDLHSYNHRRGGIDAPPDDPEQNPDINIGTGTLDRERFGRAVARLMEGLDAGTFHDKKLDVRENVRFHGGYFSKWINEMYAGKGCAIAIEFKKIFMNEWTGVANKSALGELKKIMAEAIPGMLDELQRLQKG